MGRINRDAVTGVTSAGVLIWAMWEATATGRLRRQRDLALIKGLIVISRGTEKLLRQRRAQCVEQGVLPRCVADALLTSRGLDVARRSMEAVRLQELPSAAAIDALIGARAGIENAEAAAHALASGESIPIEALDPGIHALENAADKLERELVALRTPIERLLGRKPESIR
jgi:hypothetical protein